MIGWSAKNLFSEQEHLFYKEATEIVARFPEECGGDVVRCHEAARAVGKLLGLPVEDGHYGVVEHSWLWTTPEIKEGRTWNILDVYTPGEYPPVQLFHPYWGTRDTYRPGALRDDIREDVVAALVEAGAKALSVSVYPLCRADAEALPAPAVPHVYVSITTPKCPNATLPITASTLGVLRLSFHDIADMPEDEWREVYSQDPELDGHLFHEGLGHRIFNFLQEHPSVREVVVHCDAGMSRSPAVSSVLCQTLYAGRTAFPAGHRSLRACNNRVVRCMRAAWEARTQDRESSPSAADMQPPVPAALVLAGGAAWLEHQSPPQPPAAPEAEPWLTSTRIDPGPAHDTVTVFLDHKNSGKLVVGAGEGALLEQLLRQGAASVPRPEQE